MIRSLALAAVATFAALMPAQGRIERPDNEPAAGLQKELNDLRAELRQLRATLEEIVRDRRETGAPEGRLRARAVAPLAGKVDLAPNTAEAGEPRRVRVLTEGDKGFEVVRLGEGGDAARTRVRGFLVEAGKDRDASKSKAGDKRLRGLVTDSGGLFEVEAMGADNDKNPPAKVRKLTWTTDDDKPKQQTQDGKQGGCCCNCDCCKQGGQQTVVTTPRARARAPVMLLGGSEGRAPRAFQLQTGDRTCAPARARVQTLPMLAPETPRAPKAKKAPKAPKVKDTDKAKLISV